MIVRPAPRLAGALLFVLAAFALPAAAQDVTAPEDFLGFHIGADYHLASYSQRSQRYVTHDLFDYVVPPQLEGKTVETGNGSVDAVEFYRETMEWIAERYRLLNDALGRSGESSNEDARYALPNACETKIVVTMNARELLHFFEERLCRRAQWEIRAVGEEMLTLVKETAPALFEGAGPKCLRYKRCPEGKKTCGGFEEIKRQYG